MPSNDVCVRVLPAQGLRRLVFFALVIATTAVGVLTMFDILRANGTTPLEGAILVLFSVTFAWITFAFWTAVAGFILQLSGVDPLRLKRPRPSRNADAPIVARTAIVMPVYNEETERVFAGLETTYLSLAATGEAAKFDFYLLSDTTDPAVAAAEEAAWTLLHSRLNVGGRFFYRRRSSNYGRKPGNIADFCRRWGAYYDFMVVLDADSVMTGQALLALVRAMQAEPSAGMIQTVPLPIRQHTLFGRCLQFAACLYGPMLATGLSFWQTDSANYWGHNAIIRVRAFTDHCGLPILPGEPPLGGDILSHDFVEAAFIRRAGWHVYLYAALEGSYEEVPGNVLDYAKRDRRWAQGNLQHLRLLLTHGLHPLSRLNFLLGATAYVSSLLWLTMLALSTVDAVMRAVTGHQFFGPGHQLFPYWPIVKTDEIASLLWITVGMLLLPKALGIGLCLAQRNRRRAFGGSLRLLAGTLIETVFSILIAPLMMIFHARFVVSVLLGRQTSWGPQNRGGRQVAFSEALRHGLVPTVVGLVWAAVTGSLAPRFFYWLTPVLTGLLLATPLTYWSSSAGIGEALWRWGLLLAPTETDPPLVLRKLQARLTRAPAPASSRVRPPLLLPVRYRMMPIQRLDRGPSWYRPRLSSG